MMEGLNLAEVQIIAVKVSRPVTMGLALQLVTIVMSVWDDEVEESERYQFQNLYIRSFRSEKMLTFSQYIQLIRIAIN